MRTLVPLVRSQQLFILLFSSVLFAASAKADIVPSKREGKEIWTQLAEKFKARTEKHAQKAAIPATPEQPVPPCTKTAFDCRVAGAKLPKAEQLSIDIAPFVENKTDLMAIFDFSRRHRYLNDPTVPEFLRRIPWLFPDDGCFMRAWLVNKLIEQNFENAEGLPQKSGRAFVFGDLWVDSPNSPDRVKWWYHTAATYRLANVLYVVDVALDPKNILTLEEWVNKQGVEFKTAEVSLCEANTYFPNQDCVGSAADDEMSRDHIVKYLGKERDRQSELHQSEGPQAIDRIFGDNPAWLEI